LGTIQGRVPFTTVVCAVVVPVLVLVKHFQHAARHVLRVLLAPRLSYRARLRGWIAPIFVT
jgi:hypothetical protein